MTKVDHVILTRFNLPSAGNESAVRARDGWLENRVVLFERYCLPSVMRQTSDNFRWIIYFDPESPDWLMQRITAWRADGSAFEPIFRASVSSEQRLSDMSDLFPIKGEALITTNLDNDDGLACDFIERLQGADCTPGRTALYLANGLIMQGGRTFLTSDKSNAFCSVREPWDDAVTCWAAYHNQLGSIMPTKAIGGDPAWLQVIHGANVSNRVHGKLVSPDKYRRLFPATLDEAIEPDSAERMADNFLGRPKRWLRETARLTVKKSVYALFGFEGLDKVKHAWTRLKGRS